MKILIQFNYIVSVTISCPSHHVLPTISSAVNTRVFKYTSTYFRVDSSSYSLTDYNLRNTDID